MPITSIVLHVEENQAARLVNEIGAIPGLSVEANLDSKLVVLAETVSDEEEKRLWRRLEKLQGIITMNAAYHNREDLEGNSDETDS